MTQAVAQRTGQNKQEQPSAAHRAVHPILSRLTANSKLLHVRLDAKSTSRFAVSYICSKGLRTTELFLAGSHSQARHVRAVVDKAFSF